MYKIIGANQAEYGPVTADQLRAWIVEGRADANTKARHEDSTEWKPLREFPEFAASFAAPPPPPPPQPGGYPTGIPIMPNYDGRAYAQSHVNAPAIALMVVGGINMGLALLGLLFDILGVSLSSFGNLNMGQGSMPTWFAAFTGVTALIVRGLEIAAGAYIFYGGKKMQNLQSLTACFTASILAMVPCVSPCCLIGLPIGIWALVVLNQSTVKAHFE